MKKFIYILLILLLFIPSQIYALSINSPNAILIDADTGRILYEKSSDEKAFPASTTKVMTAILTLENCKLDDTVTASYAAIMSVPSGASTANIQVGEVLTVRDLLKALLVCSANEAANVLAEHVGGSVNNFAVMMNEKAKELGAQNTNFVNANGLHDDNHYSTAHDLVLFAKYAMDTFPDFQDIVGTIRFRLPITNKYEKDDRFFLNSNQLLVPNNSSGSKNYYYSYTTGIKTGYTKEANNCLIASASKDGVNLICVVLGAEQDSNGVSYRYTDAKSIFNYGFDYVVNTTVISAGNVLKTVEIKGAKKDESTLNLVLESDLITNINRSDLYNSFEPTITLTEDLVAPISKDDIMGVASYTIYDKTFNINLLASKDIEASPNYFLGIIKFIGKCILWVIGIFAVLFCVVAYNKAKAKKRRANRRKYNLYNSRYR